MNECMELVAEVYRPRLLVVIQEVRDGHIERSQVVCSPSRPMARSRTESSIEM
jgi:hypothetical protein